MVNGLLIHKNLTGIIDFDIQYEYTNLNKKLNIYYKVFNQENNEYYIKKNRVEISTIENSILTPNQNINLLDNNPNISNGFTLNDDIQTFITNLNILKTKFYAKKG